MNHYPFHVGDYVRDTAHLSLIEDAIYRRALDWYYINERPIPADPKKAARLFRATDHQDMVASVLDEFFTLEDDGYHNKRCDEELDAYRESAVEREERDANEAERKRRYRERRKLIFQELREYGVVPKWDTSLDRLLSMLEDKKGTAKDAPRTRTGAGQVPDRDATGTEQGRAVDATGTAIQNQNQNQNHTNNTHSNAGDPLDGLISVSDLPPMRRTIPADFGISTKVRSWAIHRGYSDLEAHLESFIRKCKAQGYQRADWDEAFKGAIAEDWAGLRKPQPTPRGGAAKNIPDNNDLSWLDEGLASKAGLLG